MNHGTADSGVTLASLDGTSYDTSDDCLRMIRDGLKRDVGRHRAPDVPIHQGQPIELPRRPLDLGVGKWR